MTCVPVLHKVTHNLFKSYDGLLILYDCCVIHLVGIGKFIALDFARRGARVILACRNEARGNAALQEIRESTGSQNVHLRLLDTSSLDSVRKFAARILEEEKELHILINNAGASGGTPISAFLSI